MSDPANEDYGNSNPAYCNQCGLPLERRWPHVHWICGYRYRVFCDNECLMRWLEESIAAAVRDAVYDEE
jgi:hypothetical protein